MQSNDPSVVGLKSIKKTSQNLQINKSNQLDCCYKHTQNTNAFSLNFSAARTRWTKFIITKKFLVNNFCLLFVLFCCCKKEQDQQQPNSQIEYDVNTHRNCCFAFLRRRKTSYIHFSKSIFPSTLELYYYNWALY